MSPMEMNPVEMLGAVLVVLGGILLVVAALGVVTLPDALSRQHAATKAMTLAVMTLSAGAWLMVREGAWAWRLGLFVVFLMLTVPGASHLLARAAASEDESIVEDPWQAAPPAGQAGRDDGRPC